MTALYPLGDSIDERVRLRNQSTELRPQATALLDQVGLKPGQCAIDLGCGPSGILELLSAATSPDGLVVGVDANPAHVDMALEYVDERGLGNVEVLVADARHTGLPSGAFDFVHARTLLANLPEPAEVIAEMVRLAKPGGWVASQEPDAEYGLCYPPSQAWDRLHQIFRATFARSGTDLLIGRRLSGLLREAGLDDVSVVVHPGSYPVGHSRRTLLPDLVRSLHPAIARFGLATEAELRELDREVRLHLADPATLAMADLQVVAWGRKRG